jgi:hypothetical protein
VALASLDVFSPVIAHGLVGIVGGFYTLAIDNQLGGTFTSAGGEASDGIEFIMNRLPGAVVAPASEVGVDRLPRGKVAG